MHDPTGQALIQDITENPDDDTPRLVYADWLEDNGESDRAELIRLQLRRASLPDGASEAAKLRKRELALLKEHTSTWAATGVDGVTVEMRRGFVDHLDASAVTLAQHGSALFDRYPIRSLTIRADEFDDKSLASIATQPWFARLTHLRVQRIAGTAAGMGDSGLEKLLAGSLPRLRVLELYSCGLTARSAQAIAASGLPLSELRVNWNPIGAAGMAALAGAKSLAGLTRLDLGFSRIDAEGAEALAASSYLRSVRILNLTRTRLMVSGVRDLMASSILASVEELTLMRNTLAVRAAQLLARCGHLSNVRELDLGTNRLEDEGVAALAESPHLTSLRTLGLRNNRIAAGGALTLGEKQRWPNLRSVDLTRNGIDSYNHERVRNAFGKVSVKM